MPDRPITIIAPTVQRVLAGSCRRLYRPQGALNICRPGDRLWLREQFRLPIRFDHISPLQALERHAIPVWCADIEDLPPYATADLGRPRFARELPKAWHRAHLVVEAIEVIRAHAISETEMIASGFANTEQFALAWDKSLRGFSGTHRDKRRWQDNPAVLALSFHCIAAPIRAEIQRTAA